MKKDQRIINAVIYFVHSQVLSLALPYITKKKRNILKFLMSHKTLIAMPRRLLKLRVHFLRNSEISRTL